MTFEEYLEKNGELVYPNVGISMLPMLRQGKDLMVVRPKTEERCRKYDVVLYIRPPHDYVLHRVVEVRKDDYVILGDNCLNKEYGITDEQIIGVLRAFVRDGKTISADDRLYRLYARAWYALYPLRRAKRLCRIFLRRKLKDHRDQAEA